MAMQHLLRLVCTVYFYSAFGASPSGQSIYDYPLDYGNNYLSPYGGPDYSLDSPYSSRKPYNNLPAAYASSNLYDPNIKPFNRVNYEGGFDIKFLKNRLGLSATALSILMVRKFLQTQYLQQQDILIIISMH
jgi:hypothetical protein